MNKFYAIISIPIFLSACSPTVKENQSTYFNFDSLIRSQVSTLLKAKATLIKTVYISNKIDSTSFQPDSTQWIYELEVFSQLQLINKPTFANVYEIKDGVDDPNSNLTLLTYTALREVPIPTIHFYY